MAMPEGNAKRPTTSPERGARLKPKELKTLRTRLESARADVLASLEKAEAVARSAEPEPEPMDAAELTREQDDGALFVERARERLADIDDALAKIEAGTYGLSERSGRPIDSRRLMVVPWARLAADEE
ncbi:MAG TPA: TraR/DksA family transcriptional regulator [Polyangia bacterium]|jgi:DnaK suppressor protein|nr:TraR/DksA family transcriptional regulator [Polyangia bacterium]